MDTEVSEEGEVQRYRELVLDELDQLLFEDPDFQKVLDKIAPFNLFETLGVVHQELKHSNLLSQLLDPAGTHGLGDAFLRRFLARVLMTAGETSTGIRAAEVATWDLSSAMVRREWKHIDLLITVPAAGTRAPIAVVVENKIHGDESEHQLSTYKEVVNRNFPDHNLLLLFLTPDGDPPQWDGDYLPIDYGLIAKVVEDILDRWEDATAPDVQILLQHYLDVLRGEIIQDAEFEALCRNLYRKYSRAFDAILEHRPNPENTVREHLVELINGESDLTLVLDTGTLVQFVPNAWLRKEFQICDGTWGKHKSILRFEFYPGYNWMKLTMGPGPREFRETLFTAVHEAGEPFVPGRKKLPKFYAQLWGQPFVLGGYEDLDATELEDATRAAWDELRKAAFPKLLEALENAATAAVAHQKQPLQ